MITIDSLQDFSKVENAPLVENHTGYYQQREGNFLTIKGNEDYAISSNGSAVQVVDRNPCEDDDCPPAAWLVYQGKKFFYNYAEDKIDAVGTIEFICDLEPEWEDADVSDCEDDVDLVRKCFAFDSDETTEIMHNVLAADFFDFIETKGNKEIEHHMTIGQFAWFCGCRKRFCDKGTRFNPYDNSPDYTPYTTYYFF